jgi:hypothetical protein
MSRTIKAIERSEPDWHKATAPRVTQLRQNGERKLVAEWQRGAEILGRAQRKLRLAFAPVQSPAFAILSR